MTFSEVDQISIDDRNENLLSLLKSQVKVVMEEAVTRKFVHEESAHVLRLCGTVETCLLSGLRRRVAGFLRFNKIASLFTKVGKSLPAVGQLVTKIEEIESSFDKMSNGALVGDDGRSSQSNKSNRKYLWVRIALTAKLLDHIIAHLVANHSKYYESTSIMSDPVRGEILSSLLVGPCALDFTKMKTHDNYWSDPPAGELLQRHRLHSRHGTPSSPGRRLATNSSSRPQHRHAAQGDSPDRSSSFRDYVESLHQNSKMTLLYGKNNVVVQPREEVGAIPGYLSLHQEISSLVIKWTPNQLMNAPPAQKSGDDKAPNGEVTANEPTDSSGTVCVRNVREVPLRRTKSERSSSSYWEFAISVAVRDVVYLHCHQQASEKMGTLVLVGQDGVQWPPIRFPPGGHLLAFLTCLETGLLPHGYLDPPLWSQEGKGKVFPHLRRKTNQKSNASSDQVDEPTDFVFRVNSSSDSSYVVSSRLPGALTRPPPTPPKFDLMDSIFTLPALIGGSISRPQPLSASRLSLTLPPRSTGAISRSVVIRRELLAASSADPVAVQPVCMCSRCVAGSTNHKRARHSTNGKANGSSKKTVTWDSSDGFVPHLDMYSWDQSHPRHYDNPATRSAISPSSSGSSLRVLCDTMRRQIISRAFYGWLAHCRHLCTVRTHLSALVNPDIVAPSYPTDVTRGVDDVTWKQISSDGTPGSFNEMMRHVYFGGIQPHLRASVWPYLLEHYPPGSDKEQRRAIDEAALNKYESIKKEWLAVEAIIIQRDQEGTSSAKSSRSSARSTSAGDMQPRFLVKRQSSIVSDVFQPDPDVIVPSSPIVEHDTFQIINEGDSTQEPNGESRKTPRHTPKRGATLSDSSHVPYSSMSSAQSIDGLPSMSLKSFSIDEIDVIPEESGEERLDTSNSLSQDESGSPDLNASQDTYTEELLDNFALNLHRIEKDVQRCDRNHHYFAQDANLDKLRNVICCYVWRHLDVGYMQGMCDIAAPLLVVLDDESLVYNCYLHLMERMVKNFPNGGTMDQHFANMRSLIQILDAELFEHMHKNGDYTHFYFCYRWFLLDFKRELSYDNDVFCVWEKIWAARSVSSHHFVLFFAMAMLKMYRDIILENDMDFTDIIKFFNEMAEKHDAKKIVAIAQNLLDEVQQMIQK